jgi:hypothetical protein
MAISISRDKYEALLDFAFDRRTDRDELVALQKSIDTANGVRRFLLVIRWMERGGKTPSRIEIGKGWPPTQTFTLQLDRPISRTDVDNVLSTQAKNAVYPTVTNDELGEVGWTELDLWSFEDNV